MDAVSPSQLNTFLNCPAYWASTRLAGVFLPAGPAAARGIAIEAGLGAGLMSGADRESMTAMAHEQFDRKHVRRALNLGGDPVAQQRAQIAPTIGNAWQVLKHYGSVSVPDDQGSQWAVTTSLPGDMGVTMRGFTDFVFPGAGVIVDLKTTSRVPNHITMAHQRQMAFYAMACPGYAVDVLYASPAQVRVFRMSPDQVQRGWRQCVATVHRMGQLLARVESIEDLCGMLVPNLDSVVWRGDQAQAHLARAFPDFS